MSSQQRRIRDYHETQSGIQERLKEPVIVNPEIVSNLSKFSADRPDGYFPQGMYHVGNFLPSDKEDSYFSTLSTIVTPESNITPYGSVSADPEKLVDYVNRKKEKADYINEIRTAEALIDPNNPQTIAKVYQMFPELKEIPDDWYTKYSAMQWALRDILQAGEIRNRKDHNMIIAICAPGFFIPIFPAWDPLGMIIKATDEYQRSWGDIVEKGRQKAFWNPFQYATDGASTEDKVAKHQKNIKLLIIRRLYPLMRNKTDTEIWEWLQKSQIETSSTAEPKKYPFTKKSFDEGPVSKDKHLFNTRPNATDYQRPWESAPKVSGITFGTKTG